MVYPWKSSGGLQILVKRVAYTLFREGEARPDPKRGGSRTYISTEEWGLDRQEERAENLLGGPMHVSGSPPGTKLMNDRKMGINRYSNPSSLRVN
jgi:hypothetical protein